jgi:hypothetical protein
MGDGRSLVPCYPLLAIGLKGDPMVFTFGIGSLEAAKVSVRCIEGSSETNAY